MTLGVQEALQPRRATVELATADVGRARRELNGVVAEMRRVQQMLMARQASWDTDELAQHWAQAAAALHAKDRSMAALLGCQVLPVMACAFGIPRDKFSQANSL